MIKLNNISKKFENVVLDDFSFEFKNGRYCIMGDSGAGKTTLCNLITGLLLPDSGTIQFEKPPSFGIVFQEDRLCENINAIKNVALVTEKNRTEIQEQLSRVGLTENLNKPVRMLSGGMKRRVSIVRALINKPDIVILDEPFKGLDDKLKDNIIDYILEMTENLLLIIITHEKNEAVRITKNIFNLTTKGLIAYNKIII